MVYSWQSTIPDPKDRHNIYKRSSFNLSSYREFHLKYRPISKKVSPFSSAEKNICVIYSILSDKGLLERKDVNRNLWKSSFISFIWINNVCLLVCYIFLEAICQNNSLFRSPLIIYLSPFFLYEINVMRLLFYQYQM